MSYIWIIDDRLIPLDFTNIFIGLRFDYILLLFTVLNFNFFKNGVWYDYNHVVKCSIFMIIMIMLSWQFLSILLLTIFFELSKRSFISCMHCPICSWILVDMITYNWTHPNPFHLKSWRTWLHVHIPVFWRWKSDTVCIRMKIAKLRKKYRLTVNNRSFVFYYCSRDKLGK